MKRRIVLALVLAMFFAPVAVAAKYEWRLAEEEITDSVCDVYAKEFARLLKEKSNGDINLEVYPLGTLGTPEEIFELCQNGSIEFVLDGAGQVGNFVPENQIFSLQFLFGDDQKVNEKVLATSKALNEMLSKAYADRGIKVLAYWSEGAMDWTANRPLLKPEDFKGLKMRTMASPMILESYKVYGANPTAVPFMEVYSGLQLNMIDGQENAPYITQEMKFMEVQKYYIQSAHKIYIMQTMANKEFFEGLPAEIQKIVLDCVAELRPFAYRTQEELNDKRFELIKSAMKGDQKVLKLDPTVRVQFRELSKGTDELFLEVSGNPELARRMLDTIRAEIAAAEAEAGK
ncbi:MAG: DctP family TRAP transporter solute-binding subunit [Pyramidobacter sp.]|uniref:TRAP transporter substrate-binding protein n=1 Tax=Pyramidobacter sp. TaxID=1943581 RepID=UPI002A81A0E7|nr:DctP family TRAP transporter solute-binding subunit [Pyramidobacter sp.]MDY4033506.1 DctP family TRAP transporter solute-binding subunit [Pyramidobacter sp.]